MLAPPAWIVVDVVVTTQGGTGTGSGLFTYVTPAPTVTAIAPTSGPALGGTSVTITGTNLTGATAVNPTFPTRRKNRMNSMGAYRRSPLQGVRRDAWRCCCCGDAWVWLWRQIELELFDQ